MPDVFFMEKDKYGNEIKKVRETTQNFWRFFLGGGEEFLSYLFRLHSGPLVTAVIFFSVSSFDFNRVFRVSPHFVPFPRISLFPINVIF